MSAHCPEQLENPDWQLKPHWPSEQVGMAFAGAGQTFAQRPQFDAEVWTFTQERSQFVREPHEAAHAPARHT